MPPAPPALKPPPIRGGMDDAVLRLKPYQYVHVLDNNKNVTRVEVGPQTLTRQEHEKITAGPLEMLQIPPRHYATIANPIVRDGDGAPQFDEHGQIKLRHGEREVRYSSEPFLLYPGEQLHGEITLLTVVPANAALRLRALQDFTPEGGAQTFAGDEWSLPSCGRGGVVERRAP